MSIWFLLWLLLSAGLIYFLGWTLYILYRQKKAWKGYAKRHKLRYRSAQMLSAPEVSGTIGDYTVSLFTGEHVSEDVRRSRRLTAIEVQLSSVMPVEGGIASGGMVDLIRQMGFKEEYRPKHPGWDKSFIASSASRPVLEAYLIPERLDVLTKLMKVKNSWVILIFREDTMLLRFDTPDALDSVQKIDRIVKKMVEAAKILELGSGEGGRLKSEQTKKREKEVSLQVDEADLEAAGLQLEDDAAVKESSEEDKEEKSKEE